MQWLNGFIIIEKKKNTYKPKQTNNDILKNLIMSFFLFSVHFLRTHCRRLKAVETY